MTARQSLDELGDENKQIAAEATEIFVLVQAMFPPT
jgi:hypothetical protein